MINKLFLIAFIAVGTSVSSAAQATTATIYGTMTDTKGSSIPQANVTLESEADGLTFSAASDTRGEFVFSHLPVGPYRLRAEAAGFQKFTIERLELVSGQTLRLPLELRIGTLSESVTIVAEAPLINAATAEQRDTKDERKARELPLPVRDWTSLLRLNTGAALRLDNAYIALNGMAPFAFRFTVDGTNSSMDQELSSFGLEGSVQLIKGVSLEAIQEVSTAKGIFSADISGTLSGNINVITKRGTNSFHGSLFLNNQLDNYNARNPFLETRPGLTFNQYGGSLGGRIIKDKLFFFGAYEGYQLRSFQDISGDVPTTQFRERALAAVPAYRPIFDLFPAPNQPSVPDATSASFVGANSARGSDNHAIIRGDYYISDRNLLSARYTRARPAQSTPTIMPLNPRSYDGIVEVGTASFTHSRASLISETRFGYNLTNIKRLDGRYSLEIPNIGGVIGFSGLDGELIERGGGTASIEQSFFWRTGRHSLKFGGIWMRQTAGRENIEQPSFNYSSVDDFLANIPSQVTLTFGLREFELRTTQWGGFIHDDIRVNSRLVVNAGLRYDYFTVPEERDGRIFNRDAPFGLGQFRPADSLYNADCNNFAPRLGFAWTIDRKGGTVLRGGGGVFVSSHALFGGPVEVIQNAADEPFRVTLNRNDALALGIRFPISNDVALELVRGAPALWSGTSIDPNFPNPYSLQWLLSLQRQIRPGLVLEGAYVANRALKLNMVRMINLPDRLTGEQPFSGFGSFRYYDVSDASTYHSFQMSLRKAFSRGLTFSANYTWSNNISFSDANLGLASRPQDNDNIRANRGPTPFDVRHVFASDWIYELPFTRWAGNSKPAALLLGGWQVSGVLSAQSGLPLNIAQSTSYPSSRPDYIDGNPALEDYRGTLMYLNRAAFQLVPIISASGAALRPGTLGRNAVRGPGTWTIDLSLAKSFTLKERHRLQFRTDIFNALNHPIFATVVTNLNSGSFGRITGATARTMQLHLRYSF
jgi:carboxypeptidase family protein/TonB-dependent receptor-like protein